MDAANTEDMLQTDIPEDKPELSLMDGFKASLPTPRKKRKGSSLLKEPLLLQNGTVGRRSGRKSLAEIPSEDVAEFIEERDSIMKEQDTVRIRKALAVSDIKEIESKIATLEKMKKSLQADITKYTEQHLSLDDELDAVNERISALGKDVPSTPSKIRKPRHSMTNTPIPEVNEDVASGGRITTFKAHDTAIIALDFDLPHGTLVTATVDETPQVWDLSNGYCLGTLVGHRAPIRCLQVEETTAVTGANDSTVKIWDLNNVGSIVEGDGPLTRSLEGHTGNVTCLYFSGKTLATGSTDKTIRQWDMSTGQCVQAMDVLWAISSPSSARWQQPISPRGQSRMSMSASMPSLSSFTSAPGSVSDEYPFYNDYVGALQFWQFALASGTCDGAIRMWDMRTGQVHRTLIGHTGPVTALQFDEVNIVSGSLDKTVRIWDLRTGSVVETINFVPPQAADTLPDLSLPSSSAGVTCLQFDTRRVLAAVGDLRTVQTYNRTSMVKGSIGEHRQSVSWLRYQDEYLVTGGRDGDVGVWQM